MKQATELLEIIDQMQKVFGKIPEESWTKKPEPDKWSKKEILGHLVDSVLNNHRRFIVTQYQQNDKIIYSQDEWVHLQGYQEMNTTHIIELWTCLNRQIAHVITKIASDKLNYTCDTGKAEPKLQTLQFLIDDYLIHLKHHLAQLMTKASTNH